ncbi:hypothetical protein KJ877_05000 [bacterium]|nr:hypothetical protein [bacterium]MBU1989615.1 hypothetical protein [bacterium]
MNFSFLTSFFKEKKHTLQLPDSLLVKKLKQISKENNFLLYDNVTLYHHARSFFIPLIILDPNRGIYLFEYKDWSYDELKSATVEKSTNLDASQENLAFEKAHDFIKQKFNELSHNDGVEIFNFLLMENLNIGEYAHLDISFKELLPEHRVMFHDSSHEEILQKLKASKQATSSLPSPTDILSNLLIQYTIFDKNKNLHLCTKEQKHFIDSDIHDHQTLFARPKSGKTNTILLKAILEKLKNPDIRISIIEPTTLASDILKQKLINTVERGIVEVDITSIHIITPGELINKHLTKLNKSTLDGEAIHIDSTLMNKNFNIADLIICDDSDLLPNEFIAYLKHIQKKSDLLLISNQNNKNHTYVFEKSFVSKHRNTLFKQSNPHAKALQIISKLLESNPSSDILVISDTLSKEKLNDDLEFFIRDKAVLLDSSKNLIDQNLNALLLSTYDQLSGVDAKYVLLMDLDSASDIQTDYAMNLADDTLYILYEDDSQKLQDLRNKYESNEN